MPTLSSADAARGSSTASTASIAAIATASCSWSGSRVVSFWSSCPATSASAPSGLRRLRPANLMTSKRQAGDQRHAEDPRGEQQVPLRQADRGEDEDRHDHHDQQEARAAARVQAREALGVLGRQRQPGLEAGDRLVLGAVVLEHAAQVAQARRAARGSRGRSRCARSPSTSQKRKAEPSWSLNRLVSPTGTTKNSPTANAARRARCRTTCARDRLLVLGELRVGRHAERLEADLERLDERDDAADDRQAEQRGGAWSRRRAGTTATLDLARRASRDARTAQVETPRIITPSRTAWPPTGASRWALERTARSRHRSCIGSRRAADVSAQAPPRWRLAARRWKRSTRPPVSTSFCLPV